MDREAVKRRRSHRGKRPSVRICWNSSALTRGFKARSKTRIQLPQTFHEDRPDLWLFERLGGCCPNDETPPRLAFR
jgi:hypothetical protein